jgi:hypothetical protein
MMASAVYDGDRCQLKLRFRRVAQSWVTKLGACRLARGRWATSCAYLLILFLLCSLSVVVAVAGDDATPAPSKGEAEINSLIASLVSPNKAPPWGRDNADHYDPPAFPSNYNHNAQERIRLDRKRLLNKGISAFPALVANTNDQHYCYTKQNYNESWVNMSVGATCRDIIQIQVEV